MPVSVITFIRTVIHALLNSFNGMGCTGILQTPVTRTDGFPDKPAPDALLAMMARNGVRPEEAAMVGDRDIDIDAGHNAGMSGILFDPDGFYPALRVEMRVSSMRELSGLPLDTLGF